MSTQVAKPAQVEIQQQSIISNLNIKYPDDLIPGVRKCSADYQVFVTYSNTKNEWIMDDICAIELTSLEFLGKTIDSKSYSDITKLIKTQGIDFWKILDKYIDEKKLVKIDEIMFHIKNKINK